MLTVRALANPARRVPIVSGFELINFSFFLFAVNGKFMSTKCVNRKDFLQQTKVLLSKKPTKAKDLEMHRRDLVECLTGTSSKTFFKDQESMNIYLDLVSAVLDIESELFNSVSSECLQNVYFSSLKPHVIETALKPPHFWERNPLNEGLRFLLRYHPNLNTTADIDESLLPLENLLNFEQESGMAYNLLPVVTPSLDSKDWETIFSRPQTTFYLIKSNYIKEEGWQSL